MRSFLAVLLMVSLVMASPLNAFSEEVEPDLTEDTTLTEDATIVITAFNPDPYSDPEDPDTHTIILEAGIGQSDIPLPVTLPATVDGGETDAYSVVVADWVCEEGYDAYEPGLYTFVPTLDLGENVVLADGVVPPIVDVIVTMDVVETFESTLVTMASNIAATLHMNGGTGYNFNFVFLQSFTQTQQTIVVPGNGSVPAVYSNGNPLGQGDQLLYVLVTDTNGNPVGTILQNAIGHKSNAGAVLQADGSMGANGDMVGNTGTINFWFNGFLAPPATPPSLPTSYIVAHKVWLNADGSPNTNPPSPFNFILNGSSAGGAGSSVSNLSVLPDVPILVQDGTYTLSEPNISGYQLVSIDSSTMQTNLTAGAATATTNNSNYSATFTNQVIPNNYQFSISGLKIGNGAPLSPGIFNFAVTDNATGDVVATATNTAETYISSTSTAYGYINFTPIEYTAADVGTHTYTVSEVGTNSTSWTIDSTTQWTVQVTVSLSGNNIVVTNDVYPNIEFHNFYSAVAYFQPQATKTVTAPAKLSAGQFNFAVTDTSTNQVVSTGTNDASGNINFAPITYTSLQTGIHTYTVTETSKNSAGWIVDPRPYKLIVDVEPDTSSPTGYTITSTYEDFSGNTIPNINFVNVYNPEAFFSLSATKQAIGGALTAGQFQFAVLDENGNEVATGTNAADGTIVFSEIKYQLSDVGYHSYTIEETTPSGGGWTTSSVQYPVLVYVGDNGNGTMTVTPFDLNTSEFVFVNTYGPTGYADLTATKTVVNGTLTAGQFSFAVQDENGITVATATNDGSGNIVFPPINYTSADIGTHNYTMFETSPGGFGWSVDSTVYNVSVDVEDDGTGDGILATTITYPGGVPPTFVNTYNSVGSIVLTASKAVVGGTLAAGQFSFAVFGGGTVIATATNDANGDIIFPAILYNLSDAGKTYVYSIQETSPGGNGWTTDGNPYNVSVVVTDNGDGTIKATPTYHAGGIEFVNIYEASGSVTLEATKIAKGGDPLTDGQFEFAVLDEQGNTVATGTNDAAGDITFTPIDYTNYYVGTYNYTIVETSTDGDGWTTSTSQIPVSVSVTDNGDGTLTVETTYPAGGAAFTNTYNAQGNLLLTATKNANSGTLSAGQFSFAVQENGVTVATGANDASGNIAFTQIDYNPSDAGTHYYTVIETSTGVPLGTPGWTTDSTVYRVTVVVTDNGDGTLSITTSYPDGQLVFANTYESAGSVTLNATKIAVGNTLTADQFSFAVLDGSGNTVATGTNDAAGNITFTPIPYATGGAGAYNYTIVETSPETPGWTNSASQIPVRVVVYDDGNGNLIATPSYPSGGAVFTNTYASEGSISLTATKTAFGRALTAGQFDFAVRDQSGNVVATGTNDAAGNINFSTINYTNYDVGMHRYIVVETSVSGGGWTTSSAQIPVWVTVTDNGDGTLTITQVNPFGGVVFTNSYESAGSITLNATKTATGADLPTGKFSFAVQENGVTVATGTNDAAGNITFTSIPYITGDAGTHNYTIIETSTSGNGWTTSTSQIPVTVVVVDNGDGTLTATPTYPAGGVVFANTYASSGYVTLTATKSATGNTLTAGQFRFAVQDENGVTVATGTSDAAGDITFSPINYITSDAGTHNYTVIETSTNGNGWTVDNSTINISVSVTDNGDGTMTAIPTYPAGGVVFTNTYASSGSATLTAKKTAINNTLTAGQFEFAVLDQSGKEVATGTNDAAGNISFTSIPYTTGDAGTHNYTIIETGTGGSGWAIDSSIINVSVLVTDNGNGTMTATPTYPEGGVVFTNTYTSSGSVTLTAKKTATGAALPAGQFTFAVQENGTTVATGTNDAAGNITFTAIPYTTGDAGTHNYTIIETGTGGSGWAIDSSIINVSVLVTDNGNGTMTATPTYPEGGVVFTNTYTSSGSVTLTAKKTATGNTLTAGQFTFAVQENGTTVATGINDAAGNITFSQINYTTGDAGTHNYTIIETSTGGNGWAIDSSIINVSVLVTDNGNGTMTATQTSPTGDIVFANTYTSSGSVTLTATKKATGNTLTAGQFRFSVLDENGVTVAIGTNDAAGNITFSPLNYITGGAGTHNYTIVETGTGGNGWTIDSTTINMSITVTDNGNGTMTATPDYPAGGVVFTNTYASSGSVTLNATKTAVNNTLTAGQFEFAVLDQSGKEVATGTNDAAGNISFTSIPYTTGDAGTHDYTIIETSTNGSGWTTSTSRVPVTVVVVDNGNGTMTATPDYPAGGVVFTNTYASSGSVTLAAKKTATGAFLTAGEFSFAVQENGTTVATGTNDAAGNITFTSIPYTTGDAGTHNYTIIETSAGGSGWAVDSSIINVSVLVTDNGNGTMTATPTYPAGGVVFANTYTSSGSASLTATKAATGNTLTAGQFTFAVLDESGNTVATGTNDAAGNISFTSIPYTTGDTGVHKYTIVETSTDGSGWTTSTDQGSVTVEVVDDWSGNLTAITTYPAGGVVFTNTYEASGSLDVTATKMALGGPFTAGEFNFEILDANGDTVATGTNGDPLPPDNTQAEITFTTINYTSKDIGLHRYVVIETPPTDSAWSTSSVQIPLWITVSDVNNNGILTITQATPFGDLIFTDLFDSVGSIVLEATKIAVGEPLTDGLFSFAVIDNSSGSPVIVATGTNDANGVITFTPIDYTISDAEGSPKYYTVVETSPNAPTGTAGWMTDANTYDIEVTLVEDNTTGTIIATQTSPTSPVEFVNTYYPAKDFTVEKTVDKPSVFVGETDTWSILAAIPYGIEYCKDYSVVDPLDPDLQYVTGSISVTGLSSAAATTGDDITAVPTISWTNNTLTVDFSNEAGLTTLSGYSYILIRFDTVVEDNILDYTDFTLDNSVSVILTDNRNPPQTIYPANDPTVHTAAILINKIDAITRVGENVNGAEFQIASSAANASDGNFLKMAADGSILDVGDAGYDAAPDWVETTAGGTATTSATAEFEGLKDYSMNSRNEKAYRSYWLVETAAPPDYTLSPNSIRVVFTENNSTPANSYTLSVTVRNGNVPTNQVSTHGSSDSANQRTGDYSNMPLWILLMAVSAIGIAWIIGWRARQRSRKN